MNKLMDLRHSSASAQRIFHLWIMSKQEQAR